MTAQHVLSDFVSHIKRYGVASPNRFDINIHLPEALNDLVMASTSNLYSEAENTFPEDPSTLNSRALSLMAQSVTLPGYNTSFVESQMNETSRKIPYAKSWGEFDVTFLCSADMREKKIFDAWQKYIFKPNHTQEYYDNIISDIVVGVNSKSAYEETYHSTAYRMRVLEAYPLTVTPVTLDRTQTNAVMTFQVTFAFWKIERMEDDIQNVISNFGESADAQGAVQDIWVASPNVTVESLGTVYTVKPFNVSIFGAIDAWKTVQRAIDEIKKGVDPRRALQIVQNLIQEIETTVGLDASDQQAILAYLNDIAFGIQGFKGIIK